MIARISGTLEAVTADRAVVAAGPVAYEVLLAPVTADALRPQVGRTVTLHTLQYFDGNPAYGQMVPRLVGFLSDTDRRFFVRYVSVQGIGIARGLRSLVIPVGRIARAIESRDAPFLAELPGFGRRTAEKVIAELCGKLEEFALEAVGAAGRTPETEAKREALTALMELGLARTEAAERVEAALQRLGPEAAAEAILREAFHRGGAGTPG